MIAADTSPEFADTDIYVVGYPTPTKHGTMTVADLDTVIMNRLEADGVFERHKEVAFVAHSLGGIIIQQLLLTYRDRRLDQKVSFLYLFGTPQEGSKLANLAKYFNSDPLLKELQAGEGNFILHDMDEKWLHAGFQSIRRFCAYETNPEGKIKVVDRNSATRGCQDAVAIPGNHRDIVKPCDTRSDPYLALKNKFGSTRLSDPPALQAVTVTAPFGIAIGGGVVTNPTVNNFGRPDPLPRRITKINGDAAEAILRQATPGIKIGIQITSPDEEITYFSKQVVGLFENALWKPEYQSAVFSSISYRTDAGYLVYKGGGFVCLHTPNVTPNAQLVLDAFRVAGYPCREIASTTAGEISVFIGSRFEDN